MPLERQIIQRSRHRVKILMFPGASPRDGNRYIDIVVAALARHGHQVIPWTKELSLQSAEVFHVHWPELIADIGARRGQFLRGWWILLQFQRTIERIRRQGGRIVWTAHNLAPHHPELARTSLYRRTMQFLLPRVDAVVSLSECGVHLVREAFPQLAVTPFIVARHPHYRDMLRPVAEPREALRRRLGVPDGRRILGCIGALRPRKQVDLLVESFLRRPADDWHLLVAGAATAATAARLRCLVSARSDVTLSLRSLTSQELSDCHAVSDAVVLPGQDYFNSGTIFTALSSDTPVIAASSAVNREIQQLLDPRWLHLFPGQITTESLQRSLAGIPSDSMRGRCNLQTFDPDLAALRHIEAYAGPLRSGL